MLGLSAIMIIKGTVAEVIGLCRNFQCEEFQYEGTVRLGRSRESGKICFPAYPILQIHGLKNEFKETDGPCVGSR